MEPIQEVLKRIVKQQIVIYENGQQTPVSAVTLYDHGEIITVTVESTGATNG